MARVAVALSCSAHVRAELERLSRSRSGEVRMVERARMVLGCLAGRRNDEVARELGVRPNTVGQMAQTLCGARPGGPARCPAAGQAGQVRNGGAHPPVGAAAHPNVHFHFTPTSASWLNQVEIWFGIFQRKALNNASFGGTEQLTQAIQDFMAAYNQNAAPFVWRKREVRGSQLRNTIVNLCN